MAGISAFGESGLRQRLALARHSAPGRAALHLTAERDLENIAVNGIATQVGVSPRKFDNRFPNKEDRSAR
ncbi:hypothetical protein AB0L85_09185 [Streptomyces sp. NPDC052051]|uniref:hypothetical protein n=1 Tax=Streptomyces sp. NPDC052051 TaxID=3154649 RepID=UPI0034401A45